MMTIILPIIVALLAFTSYMISVRKREASRKLKEGGENLAKGLHQLFINSVSPNFRDNMEIHSRVEKFWRREKLFLRQFSRVVIEIFLFSEKVNADEVKNTAIVFLRNSSNGNSSKFLIGLKVTKTNQEREA